MSLRIIFRMGECLNRNYEVCCGLYVKLSDIDGNGDLPILMEIIVYDSIVSMHTLVHPHCVGTNKGRSWLS